MESHLSFAVAPFLATGILGGLADFHFWTGVGETVKHLIQSGILGGLAD